MWHLNPQKCSVYCAYKWKVIETNVDLNGENMAIYRSVFLSIYFWQSSMKSLWNRLIKYVHGCCAVPRNVYSEGRVNDSRLFRWYFRAQIQHLLFDCVWFPVHVCVWYATPIDGQFTFVVICFWSVFQFTRIKRK